MKKISLFLLMSSFFGTCGEQMITPLYGMFVSKIGGSIIDAGLGFAIFSILTGLLTIASSKIKWFEDHLGLVVFLGFLIASIGDISYVLVSNPIGLFLVQATNGISVGLLNPAWETLYTQNTDEGEEHNAWSLWGGGASISTGIASLIGSLITSWLGFKAMFITTALVNTVAVYYAYLIYRNESKTKG
jgi:predicted MFS family arabinose efflux permease